VEPDRLGALNIDRIDLLLHALELAGIEIEVAESAHRLGTQLRIGVLQLEEVPVVVHGLGRVRIQLGVLLDLYRPRLEILDGACVLGVREERTRKQQAQSENGRPSEARSQRRPHFCGSGEGCGWSGAAGVAGGGVTGGAALWAGA